MLVVGLDSRKDVHRELSALWRNPKHPASRILHPGLPVAHPPPLPPPLASWGPGLDEVDGGGEGDGVTHRHVEGRGRPVGDGGGIRWEGWTEEEMRGNQKK